MVFINIFFSSVQDFQLFHIHVKHCISNVVMMDVHYFNGVLFAFLCNVKNTFFIWLKLFEYLFCELPVHDSCPFFNWVIFLICRNSLLLLYEVPLWTMCNCKYLLILWFSFPLDLQKFLIEWSRFWGFLYVCFLYSPPALGCASHSH